jgi:signal transduction histidine kinase/CheY-like chemotaxis protein
LPLANLQWAKNAAAVPFQSALVIMTDGLTAAMLLIQYSQLGRVNTLWLSGGYLFSATIALAQFLTFPDTFRENPAIAQVSPWLWTIWHFGFPLSVLGYLVMARCCPDRRADRPVRAMILMMIGVLAGVGVLTFGLIWGHDRLPVFYDTGDRRVIRAAWTAWEMAANIAIIVGIGGYLIPRRGHWSALHLCLLLSLTALACEVFCVIFIQSRYTTYWFFARFDGVVASSTVLVLFLLDNARLYRDLANVNRTLELGVTERTAQLLAALEERERALERLSVTEAARRESEARFRTAQEAALDGFIIYEPLVDAEARVQDLRVVYANPMAARYCLSTPEAMVGRPIGDIIPGVRGPGGMIERHGSVVATRRPLEYVLDYQADGIHGHFLNMVVPFGRYLAATFRDITGSVRQCEELEAARERAERANDAKSRFLAAVSHDLRQPMQALRLLLSVASSRATAAQGQTFAHMDEAVTATERMLSRLMDYAALDSGRVPIRRELFSLDRLITEIVRENDGIALRQHVTLRLRVRPCWTDSDPVLLGRIIRNLVGNALRFTVRGGILVGIRRRCDRWRVEVWDTGPGIPADKQSVIFEEFHQLDNPERNRTKGQGLGLAIVARTARVLELPLSLCSRVGRGSVFAIEVLRSAEPAEPPKVDRAGPPIVRSGRVARILVIEDDAVQAAALQALLVAEGYRVVIARDVKGALREPTGRLDLVISDYRLPGGLSGLDGIAAIRDAAGSAIPALLLTGDTQNSIVYEAHRAGCHVLHKPYTPAILSETIDRLIIAPAPLEAAAV